VISSTSWLSMSQRMRLPLPCTCSSPAGLAFSLPTAAAVSPERTVVFAQRGSVSVVDATYLGFVFKAVQIGLSRIWPHSPGAGEYLVGPPAEQERVGPLEDAVEERIGLVDEQRRGPSAPLESAPAVLVRPAESLHHSIDRDVRDSRQFHPLSAASAGWRPHPDRCRPMDSA